MQGCSRFFGVSWWESYVDAAVFPGFAVHSWESVAALFPGLCENSWECALFPGLCENSWESVHACCFVPGIVREFLGIFYARLSVFYSQDC